MIDFTEEQGLGEVPIGPAILLSGNPKLDEKLSEAIVRLARGPYISSKDDKDLIDIIKRPLNQQFIDDYFRIIHAQLTIASIHGTEYAYIHIQPDLPSSTPHLVDRVSMNLRTAAIAAVLCRQFVSDTDDYADDVNVVHIEKETIKQALRPYLLIGTDEDKFEKEVDAAIGEAQKFSWLSPIKSGDSTTYEVSPFILCVIDCDYLAVIEKELDRYVKSRLETPEENPPKKQAASEEEASLF